MRHKTLPAIMASVIMAIAIPLPFGGASAAYITYGSIGITKGTDVDMRFIAARQACEMEASHPLRGHPRADNFLNRAAIRACLYRNGFAAEGSYAYPVPLFGSPTGRF